MRKKAVVSILLVLVPGILFLLGAGVLFLPFIGMRLNNGQFLTFPPLSVLFGGEVTLTLDGTVYSFVFQLNLYAIGTLQLILLASFAAFLSRKRNSNKILSLILGVLGIVGFCMQILFLSLASPSVGKEGLEYTGFFVAGLACLALACIGELVALLQRN